MCSLLRVSCCSWYAPQHAFFTAFASVVCRALSLCVSDIDLLSLLYRVAAGPTLTGVAELRAHPRQPRASEVHLPLLCSAWHFTCVLREHTQASAALRAHPGRLVRQKCICPARVVRLHFALRAQQSFSSFESRGGHMRQRGTGPACVVLRHSAP